MRLIDADALYFAKRYAKADPDSDRMIPVRAVDKSVIDAAAVYVFPEYNKWIPVTERLPEKNNQWVLCLCVSGAIEVLKFDYTMWNWDAQYPGRCYMENYVTHWMPLPEPPKEVPKNEAL